MAAWRGPPRPTRIGQPLWLEPYPDALLERVAGLPTGREARYDQREAIALAFVAALQRLAPRQRAVLLLRDVLGFSAAEVADMLQTSEPLVNSALHRARATMELQLPPASERPPPPRSAQERKALDEFAQAFEAGNVERIVALLSDGTLLTVPPQPGEYEGREAIGAFLANRFAARGGRRARCVWTRANGQPAFGHYIEDAHAPVCRCAGLIVLTLAADHLTHITCFGDTAILPQFGLPRTLPI